jgi:superfamily II DNA/RNA helicase
MEVVLFFDVIMQICTQNGLEDKKKINRRTIIFVNEKTRADWLAIILALENFRVMSISSQMSLKQRQDAVEAFKKGTHDLLVFFFT